jgi:hypothetical protein
VINKPVLVANDDTSMSNIAETLGATPLAFIPTFCVKMCPEKNSARIRVV